jgi:hypothetical protein
MIRSSPVPRSLGPAPLWQPSADRRRRKQLVLPVFSDRLYCGDPDHSNQRWVVTVLRAVRDRRRCGGLRPMALGVTPRVLPVHGSRLHCSSSP